MSIESGESSVSGQKLRTLKIEADGDRWKGFRPKIRLVGLWLKRAGFNPNSRVEITFIAPGLMQLRAFERNSDPGK